ncbi:MAG: GlcNAc-PI de-N-acetylase [Gemmatimonadetes bacterium]|nr:GlcNAc-PI de-N-acetylase [Gemmatimonadota bacterium]|tara:strand:+ start:2349 stop:3161 length:813 start_codon:yes stop_codon:yes gene_type:complete
MPDTLRILVFGAHPDDCDIKAGGIAIKYAALEHNVRFISFTNGDAGHHEIGGIQLAQRRRAEAETASAVAGIEYHVLDNHDGELEPTLDNRKKIIRAIRSYTPDLILTHRPNDYHPDHRYTSILVVDSAYMVTVPNICTDTPALSYNPVIAYLSDTFTRPYPFAPSVAIDIDDVVEKKLDMLHCHVSQMYEWLPYNAGEIDQVPEGSADRRKWLEHRLERFRAVANGARDQLVERYGEEKGRRVQYAEAFELCEYGERATPVQLARLFPF